MISVARARKIASDWHGGQSSALYAFASSGMLPVPGARSEVKRDIRMAEITPGYTTRDVKELRSLLDFIEYHEEMAMG